MYTPYMITACKSHSFFHRFFHNMTNDQWGELVQQFAEIQVENMDMQTMEEWITDELIYQYGKLTPDEFRERVNCFDEDLYDELVDNVTTVTYGLAEGETLSFPVHDPTK